jgi:hypothetical protein
MFPPCQFCFLSLLLAVALIFHRYHPSRSITGYCILLGSTLISWWTKRQKIMSLSSTKAEYRTITDIYYEFSWLRSLLLDLWILHLKPLLFCDNTTTLHIAFNTVFHKRTRHIEMDCHFICDKIQDDSVKTQYVSSVDQVTYVFTKPLGKEAFSTMMCKFNVLDIHSPTWEEVLRNIWSFKGNIFYLI